MARQRYLSLNAAAVPTPSQGTGRLELQTVPTVGRCHDHGDDRYCTSDSEADCQCVAVLNPGDLKLDSEPGLRQSSDTEILLSRSDTGEKQASQHRTGRQGQRAAARPMSWASVGDDRLG
jgi:hypothetical protein